MAEGFVKACEEKWSNGETDFVPTLIAYAKLLEKAERVRVKEEKKESRLWFSGNY